MLSTFKNRNQVKNSGHELEEECIAACVLASHYYDTFEGMSFKTWLAYVIAELSPYENYPRIESITPECSIPDFDMSLFNECMELMIGIMAPPNSSWSEHLLRKPGWNFGTCRWCSNKEKKDGLLTFGTNSVTIEMQDRSSYGGQKFVEVMNKFGNNASIVCLVICRSIADLKDQTLAQIPAGIAYYVMYSAGNITAVKGGGSDTRKIAIGIDLEKIYPKRAMRLCHNK